LVLLIIEKGGTHLMGYLKEIFQYIDGMDKRPEIKGSKFEKFVLAPTIK